MLNLTGVNPTASTYITAWQTDSAQPTASNLNLVPGQVRANLVTVGIGPDMRIKLYNFAGRVDLVADLTGYYGYSGTDRYTAMSPRRVVDTRDTSRVGPGGVLEVAFGDAVPAGATAVTFNLTGVSATEGTYATAWPSGTTRPTASSLNLAAGEITPNLVTIPLGADRTVSLFNFRGQVDFVVDLVGYHAPGQGAYLIGYTAERLLDTRSSGGPLGPNGSRALQVPAPPQGYTTTAIVANVTGAEPTAATYVTAWPSGTPVPTASTLNLAPGQVAANLAVISVGTGGSVSLFNRNGSTHVIVDVSSYFVVPAT